MRPLARQIHLAHRPALARRAFTTSTSKPADVQDTLVEATTAQPPPPGPLDLDPNTVSPEYEAMLLKSGKFPIGSRRRRVALRNVPGGESVPFEHLPYQTFQEARKILAADRDEKVGKIKQELSKIAKLEARDPKEVKGGQYMKDTRLASLKRYVEELKILADVNDPVVKKRYEDGVGKLHIFQFPVLAWDHNTLWTRTN